MTGLDKCSTALLAIKMLSYMMQEPCGKRNVLSYLVACKPLLKKVSSLCKYSVVPRLPMASNKHVGKLGVWAYDSHSMRSGSCLSN